MNITTTLSIGMVLLAVAACSPQQKAAPVTKLSEIKQTAPVEESATITPPAIPATATKPAPEQPRQALNLSLDNIAVESQNQAQDNDIFTIDNAQTEASRVFNTLNHKQAASGINVSGELLTDKNADLSTDLLDSVDGIKIKVEGSFK